MFYILLKLTSMVASPINLAAICVAALAWVGTGRFSGWSRVGGRFVCVILLLCGFAPTGKLLLLPLENRFTRAAPEHVDDIIVLGGALSPETSVARRDFALTNAGSRLTEAVLLAKRYPDAVVLFSGGNAGLAGGGPAEASVARDFLVQMGIAPARIRIEAHSRTTWENAVEIATMLRASNGTRLLVTSAWHMPRAAGAFRQAGLRVVTWPCGYFTTGSFADAMSDWWNFADGIQMTATALHEWGGLLVYRLQGKSNALFPS